MHHLGGEKTFGKDSKKSQISDIQVLSIFQESANLSSVMSNWSKVVFQCCWLSIRIELIKIK